jgi:hypothetical protein
MGDVGFIRRGLGTLKVYITQRDCLNIGNALKRGNVPALDNRACAGKGNSPTLG